MERQKVRLGDDADIAAWHYPGTNGGCVVMAGGFAVTKEPATDLFAQRFQDAGFHVLSFDYRGLGESGGQPRQVVRIGSQLADWRAAIGFAGTLSGVTSVALWGFSASAGHVLKVAAGNPGLAAAIVQTPNLGGLAAARNAARYQRPATMLRFTALGIADAMGGLFGRPPRLIPIAGRPGELALLTTPDALDGRQALRPQNWQQEVAARSALRLGLYRPGRVAGRVRCPLLVLVCEDDRSTVLGSALRAAARAPRGEVVRLPGRHYAPFLEQHEPAVAAQLDFLHAHLPATAPA